MIDRGLDLFGMKPLGEKEGRLRQLACQQALGIGGDENDRHVEAVEKFIVGVAVRTSVG